MAGVRIKLRGARRVQRALAVAGARFPGEVEKNLGKAAAIVERSAKLNMRGNRTRARRKKRAVTSPAGVLGIDTGTLRRSISFDVERTKRRTWRAEVGPQRVKYARIHELGGVAGRGSRIPVRPYLGPAIRKNEEKIVRLVGESFKVVTG